MNRPSHVLRTLVVLLFLAFPAAPGWAQSGMIRGLVQAKTTEEVFQILS